MFKVLDYKIVGKELTFRYRYEGKEDRIDYVERYVFPVELKIVNPKLLEMMHLITAISYYKTFIPQDIDHPYLLNRNDVEFLNQIYQNGLGEFCFNNHLKLDQIFRFKPNSEHTNTVEKRSNNQKYLLGLGGGKDSIVGLEALKAIGVEFECFVMATGINAGVVKEVAAAGESNLNVVERHFDPNFRDTLNLHGAMNGHIPISSIISFVGLLLASSLDFSNVLVANESSSSIPQAIGQNGHVNHQWSKSLDYENLLTKYLINNYDSGLSYFSPIRELSSLQVAKLFAKHSEYFNYFTSDNAVMRQGQNKLLRWTEGSSKSISSYILLAPYIDQETLLGIFGMDPLLTDGAFELVPRLIGLQPDNPVLDCVGTPNELIYSLHLLDIQKRLPKYIQEYLPKLGAVNLRYIASENNMPDPIYELLSKYFRKELSFNLVELVKTIKDIAIIGEGREGKSIAQFVKETNPSAIIKFYDQKYSEKYIDEVNALPINVLVFKSAGVPGRLIKRDYITMTTLFFDIVDQIGSKIYGITGTKGKTTTTSMVYEVLNQNFKDVRIGGNIGIPMLDLLKGATTETIFVLELSSHQLNEFIGHVDGAIITNMYKDHIPYHGDLINYHNAKLNIIDGCTRLDFVIFDSNFVPDYVTKFLETKVVQKINLADQKSIDIAGFKIFGEHNARNVLMVVALAEKLGIDKATTLSSLKEFEPVKHRLQLVREVNEVKYINDAIASMPEAAVEGIKAVSKKYGSIGVMLVGGQDRGYDFSELAKTIKEYKVGLLLAFPDTGQIIAELADGVPVIEVNDMSEAVKIAAQKAAPGTAVLLSSGSPSYSLWKDFEQKGQLFIDAVNKI